MEKPQNPLIDKIFKAIADPTRREIFHALVVASAALTITHLTQRFEISRQGVTKHIKTLESAGLITIEKQGRERYCQAQPEQLKLISEWLAFYDRFWTNALDRLEDHLNP